MGDESALGLTLGFLKQLCLREGSEEQGTSFCSRCSPSPGVVVQHSVSEQLCPVPSRCACIDARHAQKASRKWSLEMDVALVQYINRLCRHLAITPARLHPHEVYLDPADAADPRISCLLSAYGWLA